MKPSPEQSYLRVRRSVHIRAEPLDVWQEFVSFEAMQRWWGKVIGTPEAGTSAGQWLDVYEPKPGGKIQMAVNWDGARVSYGGTVLTFEAGSEFTFENDWIPNRGWAHPTYVTLRLSRASDGTLVELFHYGFERIGGDASAEHAGYETGWGMTQLLALKDLIESERSLR